MSHLPPEFQYKISLGQNFIFDENLLNRLVEGASLPRDASVLEIGAGRGDLTAALARQAGQVVAVEIDSRLEPVLKARFEGQANVHLVMGDVMELDLQALMAPHGAFHVVANLPYYLTTPILNRLLLSKLPIKSIHVMVQQEASERVLAGPGTAEYGPLAVLAAYRGMPKVAFHVPARCFTPPPKVDSVFLNMPLFDSPPVQVRDEAVFLKTIQAAFAMRRKTLANNLVKAFSLNREQAISLIQAAGLPESVRGERLNLAEFAALSNQIVNSQ